MKLGIIDYGAGNLLSLCRAFEHIGIYPDLVTTAKEINNCDKIVLPGVGAFPYAMDKLKNMQLISIIQEFARQNRPLLGICLGMQLLFYWSEEFGITPGLQLLPGRVMALPDKTLNGNQIKKPNIGWCPVFRNNEYKSLHEDILSDIPNGEDFYFVHSYCAHPEDKKHILATSIFGDNVFSSVVRYKNIFGCQFHPEKSGLYGLQVLKNFTLSKVIEII